MDDSLVTCTLTSTVTFCRLHQQSRPENQFVFLTDDLLFELMPTMEEVIERTSETKEGAHKRTRLGVEHTMSASALPFLPDAAFHRWERMKGLPLISMTE